MQKDHDLRTVADFVERIVRQAGQVILSFSERQIVIERKNIGQSSIDIVTDADRASEQIILEAISKEFPGHDIISEETLPQVTDSRWKWFVDPLDGTVNFAHHYPFFSVSIALMDGRDLVVGMVYDPLRDECFSATRNGGAFLNGRAIRVSSVDRLEKSIVATGFPYDRATSPDNNVAEFSAVVTRVQGMRRCGSAAIDLAYVACGRLDGFWELKLKPWDMAAGMLLVQEAGGRVSDRTGRSTDVYTRSVVATNGLIHDMLTGLLSSV
jgi:myo-inositol-1(or 4)-monophosphatase